MFKGGLIAADYENVSDCPELGNRNKGFWLYIPVTSGQCSDHWAIETIYLEFVFLSNDTCQLEISNLPERRHGHVQY